MPAATMTSTVSPDQNAKKTTLGADLFQGLTACHAHTWEGMASHWPESLCLDRLLAQARSKSVACRSTVFVSCASLSPLALLG